MINPEILLFLSKSIMVGLAIFCYWWIFWFVPNDLNGMTVANDGLKKYAKNAMWPNMILIVIILSIFSLLYLTFGYDDYKASYEAHVSQNK